MRTSLWEIEGESYLHGSLSVQMLDLDELFSLIIVAHDSFDGSGRTISDSVSELLLRKEDLELGGTFCDLLPGIVEFSKFIELRGCDHPVINTHFV